MDNKGEHEMSNNSIHSAALAIRRAIRRSRRPDYRFTTHTHTCVRCGAFVARVLGMIERCPSAHREVCETCAVSFVAARRA